MKILLQWLLCGGLGLLCLPWGLAQNALHFDGDNDWVDLPFTGTSLANPNPDFSISLWFQTENTNTNPNCGGNYKRLLSLGAGTGDRFEIGECGNNSLQLFYDIPNNFLSTTPLATLNLNTWHHICVIKNGFNISIWVDNVSVFTTNLTPANNIQFDYLRLGHWPFTPTPGQDWIGTMDELQVYDAALNPADLCANSHCPLSGNEANLFAYWTFDDPGIIPGGNNTGITQVTDYSLNGNVGVFGTPTTSPFALNGSVSNFTANNAPMVFPALHDLGLEIRDYPYRNNLLTGICEGEPIHVCLNDNGTTPGPYSNVTVHWEQSDDGGIMWNPVPTSTNFLDFCFPVQPGLLTIPCTGNNDGFVDRKYRAISTVTGSGSETCEYISDEYDLQICCPIGGANLQVVPSGPFCEGDMIDFQVDLNPNDPFVMNPGPNVTIDWFFVEPGPVRTPLPAYANMVSFFDPGWTVPFPSGGVPGQYCYEAEVRNCQGKLAVFTQCVTVDPQPVCGTIEGSPLGSPQNLSLISASPLVYEICPGNDAKLEIATPFDYCIPQWQYSFDQISWTDMGFSNNIQNLNIIPGHHYPWPAGADRIYYRIQCNPLSMPSGCDPCFSDPVEVRLHPTFAVPVIAGPTQACLENLPTTLSVSNPITGVTYNWYHDGLFFGAGTSIITSQAGCYWIEANDDCHITESVRHCLEVCETIARISCPLVPNECAQLGQAIELSACASENTCSGNTSTALTYLWSTGATSCTIMDIPPAGGTTYSVTVTDPATGCVGVAQRTVVPCDF